jgi:hypothetical protein
LLFFTTSARAQSSCLHVDHDALALRSFIRELVVSTDTARESIRTALGFPAMDSTQVQIVSNNRICARIAKGYNSALKTPNLVRHVYVVSLGKSYFAAKDPGHPAGEWWPTASFDRRYNFLHELLSP